MTETNQELVTQTSTALKVLEDFVLWKITGITFYNNTWRISVIGSKDIITVVLKELTFEIHLDNEETKEHYTQYADTLKEVLFTVQALVEDYKDLPEF